MPRPAARRRVPRPLILHLLPLALAACGRPAPPPAAATPAAVQPLYDACVSAMLQSTCRVAQDRSAPPSAGADLVFVAGVGPVDAQAYRALRASGDAMCSVMREACTADWSGAQCRTARSLWEASVPPPR
jgi:hypothetical protein